MWSKIQQIIDHCKHFVITTHINPDGDGIGSACALTELLLHLGKSVRFICNDPVPKKFSFLNWHNTHETFDPQEDYSSIDALIVLDAHEKERIGNLYHLMQLKGLTTACIDHHPQKIPLSSNTVINPKACSVGEMIYDLFKLYQFPLNIRSATGLYTSILCDTGRFSNASTNQKAHKIANECISAGVDPDILNIQIFQQVPLEQIKALASALQTMEMHANNQIVIQKISLDDYDADESSIQDIEHLHHELHKAIEGVECVVILREMPNQNIRLSIRSKSHLDIGKVMRNQGGGGHSKAAGATWNCSMEQAKDKIVKILSDELGVC